MCELLAVGWPDPHPADEVVAWALQLERLGVAGFGWGVAWVPDDGAVRVVRRPTRMADDAEGRALLTGVASRRYLVHLRRPSRLSTLQEADTQPFRQADGRFAFCHNGHLDRHAEYRGRFAGRLRGRADSEVGFALLSEALDGGAEPAAALAEVHERLEGNANFGLAMADGTLHTYGGHDGNRLWRFRTGSADVAATALHSDDESLFDLLFRGATDRAEIRGAAMLVGPTARAGAQRG